jgi:hypothetical protein
MSGLIPQEFAAELKPLPATNERKFYRPGWVQRHIGSVATLATPQNMVSFSQRIR